MKDFKPTDTAAEAQKRTWQVVLKELKKDIIYGRLQPKEHLLEDELMTRFGVSRYAVRRALEELHSCGLAVRTENRGTRIRSYSPQEVLDLYEMREILERESASRIPMPPSAALIKELTRIQKAYDSAAQRGDWHSIHMLNDEFHRTLFSACPNRLLADQVELLALQAQPVRIRFVADQERRKRAGRDHWAVIDALKHGDNVKLAEVCARHISFGREEYARTLVIEPLIAQA
ncbi:GntR family transcriptional regulator [Variovorax sp. J22R133]|uniref:GntR family transcriptional regulator n=1 Tax=Variovorax brevis TaxID=3053503 RepID=UPI002574AA03|nr:GntR family transcriptional regulator [Variovorax sp. J22R133]MDM0116270.1 GntR family transcriptional regulator [Variovorax sp. J22R133]